MGKLGEGVRGGRMEVREFEARERWTREGCRGRSEGGMGPVM